MQLNDLDFKFDNALMQKNDITINLGIKMHKKIDRVIPLLIIAIIASSSSFVIHLASAEWLPEWISQQMQGVSIQPSWNIKYIALLTSIEYGVAAIILYILIQDKLFKYRLPFRILIFSALLTATHGALVRQPLMDYLIGNPLKVTLAQNGMKWLVWILMATVVIIGIEAFASNKSNSSDSTKQKACSDH
ncbi:hypothetical protein ACJJI5_06350 [Microbulbifer sp. EKSA008]|uniref:hypothetical protein n=1 Tax=unclassified Microbulbifer TaxID=2619833 RepID=UPI0040419EA1